MSLPTDPPPDPQPSTESPARAKADLLPRGLARMVDLLAVAIVTSVLARLVVAATGISTMVRTSVLLAAVLQAVASSLLVVAYTTLAETRFGTTLGKRLVGLAVEGPDGGRPTPSQAFRRNAWLLAGLVPILGSLAMIAFVALIAATAAASESGSGWHDEIAGGTRVVRA